MEQITFKEFFKNASGFAPYPYQEKLANAKDISEILSIPTGAGKTEAAVLAIYVWRRIYSNQDVRKNTPRRLVYCLPMRVLVEQTVSKVKRWIENLKLENKIKVITIMGGNAEYDYRLYPESDAIIIGTQDMLLSRALNRGYAMNPFQWPVEFGLLNNDCLWIMDEIQLMHNGLATSIQLEEFRDRKKTYAPHKTVWMSATINPQWLKTVDSDPEKYTKFELSKEDTENESLSKRNNAKKRLEELKLSKHKDEYTKNDAIEIKKKHDTGTVTLIIVNTVKRAQSLFEELKKISEKTDIMLIHSRFRRKERANINKKIQNISEKSDEKQDMIIVSTQVIEAGVDISAKTLITEMAPWSSMVQRFGRCNRKGEHDDSKVYFIRLAENQYIPYEKEDMERSEKKIDKSIGKSLSPKSIPKIDETITHEIVIRESDVLGLFDSTPDLSGSHTDVSRYVRSLEKTTDVGALWREWDEKQRPPKHKIRNEEICNVPISDIKEFIKKNSIWKYDVLDGYWERSYDVHPGQTYLIYSKSGGYTEEKGWHVKLDDYVKPVEKDLEDKSHPDNINKTKPISESEEESLNSDPISENSDWITLNDHTVHVLTKTKKILEQLEHLTELKDVMIIVAKYHDIGKAHTVFQNTMLKNTDDTSVSCDEIWAKRGGRANHERKNFRHEAASALAFLKLNIQTDVDLAAYLIASHHGKMRLSMRSLPEKKGTKYINSDGSYILGMKLDETEKLSIFLSNKMKESKESKEEKLQENIDKEIKIDASITRIGKKDNSRSWLQITLGLLKKHGPFKLAYLEAVIRAADSRASEDERSKS